MILRFLEPYQASEIRLLHPFDERDVPEGAGAYILLAEGSFRFTYPWGRSPVYYIGQARNLRTRIRDHHHFVREAGGQPTRKLPLYWPRYEYACAVGARYTTLRTKGRQGPKALEDQLLTRFARTYGCWPVANGMGSWSRVRQVFASGAKK